MNDNLIQKLKDAGFPRLENWKPNYRTLLIPTLSELIEACGEGFWNLYRAKNVGMVGLDSKKFHFGAETNPDMNIGIQTGTTPEIAVANLWLKLNEK